MTAARKVISKLQLIIQYIQQVTLPLQFDLIWTINLQIIITDQTSGLFHEAGNILQ